MSEREAILGRIREALRRQAPRPAGPGHGPANRRGAGSRELDIARFLPSVGGTPRDWIDVFAKASEELRTVFKVMVNESEVLEGVKGLAQAEGWRRLATHRAPWTESVAQALSLPVFWTEEGYDKAALESCDAGMTLCDLLVAQTGSVVVTARNAGGRALSVLPPHHVVLARREQLVSDLPSAFRRLQLSYGADYPSMISFITGPSRTGDIERVLVLGAHGPKKLTVLMC